VPEANQLSLRRERRESVPRNNLGFLIHDVARALTAAFAVGMNPLGLTRSQSRVLAYVSRYPGVSQIELAELIGVGRMAMTGLIDRMEAKGLIFRSEDSSDRRLKCIHLTRDAKKLAPKMQKVASELLEDVLAGVSERDQRKLTNLLNHIQANARNLAGESQTK